MLGRKYDNQNCSAARALELVGERWSLLIIRDALFRRITRFSDFERSLGVAPNVLAARLEGFVEARLMVRRPIADGYERSEYLLTDKGLDLQPVIIALTAWGDRWAAPNGPPVEFEHAACGGRVEQLTTCAACGELLEPTSVAARPGSAAYG